MARLTLLDGGAASAQPAGESRDLPDAEMHILDSGHFDYVLQGTGLLSGCTAGYDIGQDKSLDVDSEFDFELIEFLMRKKLGQ